MGKMIKVNRFLLAPLLVALSATLRIWPLHSLESSIPFLTFYPAVMLAAVYGGLFTGLFATALSCVIVILLWPLLVANPFIDGPSGWLGMAVFALTCAVISAVAEVMLRSRIRAMKAEETMRAILDNTDYGVITIDGNGIISSVNPAAERIFGYGVQDMTGQNVTMFMTEHDAGRHDEYLRRYRETGEKHVIGRWRQVTGRRKNGDLFPVEINIGEMMIDGARFFTGMINDITNRKRAEGHYRALFDQSPLPKWVYSVETLRFLAVNNAAVRHYGYSRKEFLEMSIRDIYTEEDLPILNSIAESIHHDDWKGEVHHRKKDGTVIDISIWARPFEMYGQEACLVVIQDITAQKLAETALKSAEIKYHTLFEKSPDGVLIVDAANGRNVDFNETAYRQLGYTRDEFAGLTISDYEAKESPEDTQRHITKILAEGTGTFETMHRTKTGELRNVKVIVDTITLDGIPYIHAIFRDITIQKVNERRIQESEERFRRLFEESPIGISVYEADGRCVMANEAAAVIIGAMREEMLCQNFREIRSWQQTVLLETALRALSQGRTCRCEVHVDSMFGKHVDLDSEFTPITIDGRPHLMVFIIDITHLHEAEIKMKEARDVAENAAKSKSEFLANMSHEIRTPMNAIIGLTGLALETGLSIKQADYLRKIQKSSMALLKILNDILDFSKIEAGRLKIESIEFALEESLENTLNLFMAKAEEKGLEMFCDVGWDVPPILMGDPLRLGQVLNNVVGNAVKFTERGEILIRVELAEVSEESCVLRFTVRDTGIGISSGQVKKLFAPFQQADGSISREYGGTGLGLAISHKLVHLMGGDIFLSSLPGQGSSFFFTSRFGIAKTGAFKGEIVNPRAMKTLVVDDSPTSLGIMKSLLGRWNFEVAVCLSGDEGLQFMGQAEKAGAPFQLLFLDWKMPNRAGRVMAERIIENILGGRLTRPFIVFMATSFSRDYLLEEGEPVMPDAVLTKPVREAGLYNTLLGLHQPEEPRPVETRIPEQRHPVNVNDIRGARILLVEDNEINRQVVFELLSNFGLQVTMANSGDAALVMVGREVFDGILMDLQMPGLDGYNTALLIQAKPGYRDVPIIAISAAVMPEDRQRCFLSGMVDHIPKPIIPEVLISTLIKWVKPTGQFPAVDRSGGPSESEGYEIPPDQPGLNLPDALHRVGGNKKILSRLLHKFSDEFSSVISRLDNYATTGDAKAMLELLHKLRGVSGSLGATELHDLSLQLENEIKAGRIPVSLEKMDEALQSLMKFIAQSVRKPEVPADRAEETGGKDLAGRLEILASHLKSQEVYPLESLAMVISMLKRSVNDELASRLGKQIDNFDYKGALGTLHEIAGKLNIDLKW